MKKGYFIVAIITAIVTSIITTYAQGLIPQFPDVDQNAYYASSVDRMVQLGVVNGYENGNFGPNDAVTRAQIATMLDRYDSMLLNTNPKGGASGVYDLITIICDNGLGKTLTDPSAQEKYNKLCSI